MRDKEVIKYKRLTYLVWLSVGTILLLFAFIYVLNFLKPILTPFILAVAIVYLFRPAVIYLEKKGLPRILSITLVYFLFFLIFFLFIVYFVPLISRQLYEFGRNFPAYFDRLLKEITSLQSRYARLEIPSWANQFFEQASANIRDLLVRFASDLPTLGINLVSSFFANLFFFILSFLLGFYLLKDYETIRETIYELFPTSWRSHGKTLLSRVSAVVRGYIIGQVIVSLSVGILSTIVLFILGVDYALLIGFVTGVLNVIPYFGPVVGGVLAGLVALFKSPLLALWAILAMTLVQQLDSFFISPNIMSYQVRLHPVLIVFSLLAGGLLWGAMGLLLSIPVAAALKAVVYYFFEESRAKQKVKEKVAKSGKQGNKGKVS